LAWRGATGLLNTEAGTGRVAFDDERPLEVWELKNRHRRQCPLKGTEHALGIVVPAEALLCGAGQ
jgi:hypothetical protein